jgi:hypothetical protein
MSNSSRDFPFELFLLWGHGRPIVGSESPPTVTTRLMQQQQQNKNKNLKGGCERGKKMSFQIKMKGELFF